MTRIVKGAKQRDELGDLLADWGKDCWTPSNLKRLSHMLISIRLHCDPTMT